LRLDTDASRWAGSTCRASRWKGRASIRWRRHKRYARTPASSVDSRSSGRWSAVRAALRCEDIARLLEVRRQLGQDIRYVDCSLPSLAQLPDAGLPCCKRTVTWRFRALTLSARRALPRSRTRARRGTGRPKT
jgi:hypothetical protein